MPTSRVDDIAADLVSRFMAKLRKHPTYRGAMHTQSVLTITSNVVYGKATGNTPDGRRKGEPFAPGANPMHGRDSHGWLASCISVGGCPMPTRRTASATRSRVAPSLARRDAEAAIDNAVKAFDMYFGQGGFHMNLNVLSKETLRGRDGASGEVPAAHHPRLGLRGELRAPDARAAARRHPPHLPRQATEESGHGRTTAWWRSAAATTCAPAARPTRPRPTSFEGAEGDLRLGAFLRDRLDGGRAGRRITLFMSGCLLRCQYCHNPDTWQLKDGTQVELSHAPSARLGDFAPALRAMGGGLTISGGEPLVQVGFTRGMFAAAKRMGLHTALDTSGFLGHAPTTTICRTSTW